MVCPTLKQCSQRINGLDVQKHFSLDRIDTHHTNSTLVRKYNLVENLSNVPLDTNYNFKQKNHQSIPVLPNFYLKQGSAKKREDCTTSSLYSLIWTHAQITKGKERVPSWSGFYKFVSKPDLD